MGFSDPLGIAKTLSRGDQKFSKAVQLPDCPPSSRTLDKLQEIGTLLSDLVTSFLPERDYVTFGSLLSQFRLSVCRLSVCRLSVTLVHPTQGVEPFGKISSPLCTLAIL